MSSSVYRVGLISDTHGLLRAEASAALRGVDAIIHAGDIGNPAILDALATIAPVTAVRGNNDTDSWARALPESATLDAATVRIHVLHDLALLDIDPAREGVRVVVAGHSHRPRIVESEGVLYVNPGSAGPRRFTLPVSVGELAIDNGRIEPTLIRLDGAGAS